jgi:hypothetical protein
MREIPLGLRARKYVGLVAIVDDCDYDTLAPFMWYAVLYRSSFYAVRNVQLPDGLHRLVRMHRQILGVGPGVKVDHVNHNTLDDRNENLRIATTRQNAQNMGKRPGTSSRYKGVWRDQSRRKWTAQIRSGPIGLNGWARLVHLGYFDDEEAADHAYDGAALASFGAFACLNFPGEVHGNPDRPRH